MKMIQVQVEFNFLEALFKNSVQKSEASFDDTSLIFLNFLSENKKYYSNF